MQGIRSKANVINLFLTIFSCMAYYKDSKELCLQALGPWVMKTAGQVFVNPHKNENLNKFYLFFIFFDISMLVSIGLIASIKKNPHYDFNTDKVCNSLRIQVLVDTCAMST